MPGQGKTLNNLFAPLPPKVQQQMASVPALIEKTFPLPGRFRLGLPKDVAELSRLLTSGKGERALSYLSRPNLLSAYLRYFLPWNIFRLCRLLPFLGLRLSPGDVIIDLGCGPLTFAAALWISRPDLHAMPLEFHCIDRTANIMAAGKKFFAALTAAGSGDTIHGDTIHGDTRHGDTRHGAARHGDAPWKISTARGSVSPKGILSHNAGKKHGPGRSVKHKPAALVCAANVFNEIYGDIHYHNSLESAALNSARLLDSLCADMASILVLEPGVPRWGEFLSCLRNALIEKGRFPLSPCTHDQACPFPGGTVKNGKNRWCHFAFDTQDAPDALHRLSAAAGIPKERAVLSFLLAGTRGQAMCRQDTCKQPEIIPARIISDAFPLPQDQCGRYGCSEQGPVLVTGKRADIEKLSSGTLINALPVKPLRRDPKSGALVVRE